MSSNSSEYTVQPGKFLPFLMDDLTPEMIRKAEEELNETPETKQKALEKLKNLINAEEDFQPRTDDNFLLRFLRAKKFNPESAMKTLKNFYTNKAYYSRVITDKLPSEVKHVFDMNCVTVLPQRDREGRVIGMFKTGDLDLNKVSLNELLAMAFIVAEILLQSEATQICGVVYVSNHKGMSLRLVRQLAFHPHVFRIVKVFLEIIPIRIKALHLANEPFYYKLLFNVLKPLISQKLKNRVHFHGKNLEGLHKDVPPEILPRELGGHQGRFDNSVILKKVLSEEGHFSKLFKFGFQGKRFQDIRRKLELND